MDSVKGTRNPRKRPPGAGTANNAFVKNNFLAQRLEQCRGNDVQHSIDDVEPDKADSDYGGGEE